MKTKSIVEGALLSGLTVVLTLLGFYLPVLGNFFLIVTPLPLIILTVRHGSKISTIASLLTGIILAILVNPLLFLVVLLTIGLIGVSMGAAFEENFSSGIILVIGIFATTVALLLSLGVNLYILDIDILTQIKQGLDISTQIYGEMGISKDVLSETSQILDQTIEFIRVTFPAVFLCIGIIVASINFYFSTMVLNRLGYDYPSFISVRKIKFPKLLAMVYIISILFNDTILGKNFFVISSFLIILEGLAVAYYYFLNFNINKAFTRGLVVALLFIPLLNQLILLLGFLDLWIDFRKLDKS